MKILSLTEDQKARFWAKVDRTSHCWNWTGYIKPDGYGQWRPSKTEAPFTVHRVSFILNYGQISSDEHVCHRCDNPRCVKPDHLFKGTMYDNMRDAYAKGRMKNTFEKGIVAHNRRYNKDQVLEMRRLRKEGSTYKAIGDIFECNKSLACKIVNKVHYSEI